MRRRRKCCPRGTIAEKLLDMAKAIQYPRDQLVLAPSESLHNGALGRVATAIQFTHLSPAKRMMAIVEDWDYCRIVREIY